MSTFNLTLYQKNPRGGYDEVTFELDQRLCVVSESRKTVESYSARNAQRAFSQALINGGPVLRKGVDEELKAEQEKRTAEIIARESTRMQTQKATIVPDSAARLGIAILTGENPPCNGNPECLKIREDYQAARAAISDEKGGCAPCKAGPLLAEYQKRLFVAGITKTEAKP